MELKRGRWQSKCCDVMVSLGVMFPRERHSQTENPSYHVWRRDMTAMRQATIAPYSTTPRNGNRVNGNHLGICLSSSRKNGNSLTWVLVALTVCFTYPVLCSIESYRPLSAIPGSTQTKTIPPVRESDSDALTFEGVTRLRFSLGPAGCRSGKD